MKFQKCYFEYTQLHVISAFGEVAAGNSGSKLTKQQQYKNNSYIPNCNLDGDFLPVSVVCSLAEGTQSLSGW